MCLNEIKGEEIKQDKMESSCIKSDQTRWNQIILSCMNLNEVIEIKSNETKLYQIKTDQIES